jgi:uncharacterized protein
MTQRIPERIAAFCIRARVLVLSVVGLLTLFFLFFAAKVQIRTQFDDLMPLRHPYIKVHQEFKESFGGSNMVSIMLEVKQGDIFRPEILKMIKNIQGDLLMVSGVNEFQIISLASKKLRDIKAGSEGIERVPLMWPDVPETPEEIQKLKEKVLSNRLVYGTYVSLDLKSALITVDFIERQMEFEKVYKEINEILSKYKNGEVEISVVGEPILQGLIRSYLPQTAKLLAWSFGILGILLFVFFMRSYRGTFVPLFAALVAAIWALGLASIFKLNFDPLGVVIAFLISARVISHAVQSINRFDILIQEGMESAKAAAQGSLGELFIPGTLSAVADAGCMMVVTLAPIPMLQKIAVIGAIWMLCIFISGVILTPVLMSYVRHPEKYAHPFDITPLINKLLATLGNIAVSRFRYVIFFGSLIILVICGYFGLNITIGDANPGSPLLWQDSEYNVAVSKINSRFLGTDRMFVVFRGKEANALKEPDVLSEMIKFQRYIERQPEIGGTLSIADVIPVVKRVLYEDNPRYEEVGTDKPMNGELFFMFLTGTEPGDLSRFCDVKYTNASVTLFFRDHQGSTIRTAIASMKEFIKNEKMNYAQLELCGGLVGVLAAANEVIFSGQVESIALGLFVVLVLAALTYRSGSAGLYYMFPILLSNAITFTYMAINKIGLNVNSLPVAALGIGLGVDYVIYVVDSIKEEYACNANMKQAVIHALNNAGRGVLLTATPLIVCSFFWYLFSSLRFQAEMAVLIAIWMTVSSISALLVMPATIYIMKPRFVVGDAESCMVHPEIVSGGKAA